MANRPLRQRLTDAWRDRPSRGEAIDRAGKAWTAIEHWLRRHYLRALVGLYGLVFVVYGLNLAFLLYDAVAAVAAELVDKADDPVALRGLAYPLGVGITALAALLAAPLVLIRTYVAERQATTAEQGHITDRFTKAVEQLGAEKTVKRIARIKDPRTGGRRRETVEETVPNLEVRLGAIYALERIAQDSERDHIPIMETLCAYIRENAPARIDEA
ncbi:MAG: hypothetical protein AAFR52_14740, partial [Pseudomonadota bacterium]